MESPGFGVWIIGAVLAFNLACIPLWFLVRHLQRNHELYLQQCQLFLALFQETLGDPKTGDDQLSASIGTLEEQLEQAEALGPLWGRKALALARLSVAQLEHLRPDEAARVWLKMQPGQDPSSR